MRTIIAALLVFTLAFAAPAMAKGGHGSTVHVRAHTTKTGIYVPAHVRTAPDHSKANNWSTKGNVNPHTGKEGTRDPYKQ